MEVERVSRVATLCGELAAGSHEPVGVFEAASTADRDGGVEHGPSRRLVGRLVVRVLCFVDPLEVGEAACCRRWLCATRSPALWHEACSRVAAALESLSLRRARGAKKERGAVEAARRGLAAVPGSAFVELRDSLAAAARASGPQPTSSTAAVLDAATGVVGRPGGSARHWRAALEGAKDSKLKLSVALSRVDVSALAVEAPARLNALAAAVARPDFPTPSFASRRNLLVGRLCAWCVAAAALGARLGSEDEVPNAAAVATLGERAARRWIQLCEAPKNVTNGAVDDGNNNNNNNNKVSTTRRKKKCASAPPASPSLYDIYVDSRRLPAREDLDDEAVERCAQMLRRFYEKHNPHLVPRAHAISREWRGSESTLFALLRYKYGKRQSTPGLDDALATAEAPPSERRLGRRSLPPDDVARKLRDEIDRLRSSVDKAQTDADRARSRAAAAAAETRRVRESQREDRSEAARLREDAAALRRERDARDHQLAELRSALELVVAKTPSSPTSLPPVPDDGEIDAPPDLDDCAVDAVLSAVVDVLLTESAIEIDFELDFGGADSGDRDATPTPQPPDKVVPPPAPNGRRTSSDRSARGKKARSVSPARVMPLLPIDQLDAHDGTAPLPPPPVVVVVAPTPSLRPTTA